MNESRKSPFHRCRGSLRTLMVAGARNDDSNQKNDWASLLLTRSRSGTLFATRVDRTLLMPRWTLALAVMLVTPLSIGAANASQAQAGEGRRPPNPPAATPKSIAAGEKVFRTYCRMCHGNDARGDGPLAPPGSHPPNLTDDTWSHGSTDAEILEVIRNGIGPKFDMKGFRSRLTDEEVWSVIHYLRSLHASSPR